MDTISAYTNLQRTTNHKTHKEIRPEIFKQTKKILTRLFLELFDKNKEILEI
jgi:hypothetical protein